MANPDRYHGPINIEEDIPYDPQDPLTWPKEQFMEYMEQLASSSGGIVFENTDPNARGKVRGPGRYSNR